MRAVHHLALASLLALSLASSAEAQGLHRVRPGQTLASIARRHGISVSDLAAANRITTSSLLRVGQELRVPGRGVVYVRAGQTLSHIARANDVSIAALARANRMRTSDNLRIGQRLVLPGYRATRAVRRIPEEWGKPEAPGVLHIRTRNGVVEAPVMDHLGRVRRDGLEKLAAIMHDADAAAAEGDEARASGPLPEPRLARLLAAISDHFGGREIQIISGFREVGGYTRETSRHVHGRAADIRVRGVPHRLVWDFCRSLSHTGCGLYPRSTFVHVDVRDTNNQWVDWSGPGQRPRYGTLRGPYTRRQRRSRSRPRVGRHITRPAEVPLEVAVVE